MGTGETTGIFQLESPGMKDTLKNLKPDKFEDIIALVALYRPGPMANIPTYVERKHGREKLDYVHPLLESLLKETYGVIIYQEQVMGVARELSGYSDGEADLLRRAMGKKIQKEMTAQKKRFVEGCIKKGLKDNEANNIFELLSKFADYGFNKSHAAAYALIAFQTAYLKKHHPIEFFAASMSLDINNTDKLAIFQQELVRMKVPLVAPDVNRSNAYFVREGNGILYALGAIKNVGIEAIKELQQERKKNGKFSDFNDFLMRVSTSVSNKKTLEALACSGSFDTFNVKREHVFNECPEIIKHLKHFHDSNNSNQEDIFGETSNFNYQFKSKENWTEETRLMKEFEILGFYLSGHPLTQFLSKVNKLNIKDFESIKSNKSFHNEKNILLAGTLLSKKEKRSARGNAYAFLNFSDLTSIYELIIFENNLRKYRDILVEGDSYAIGIDFTDDGNGLRGEAKKIYKIEEVIKMNEKSYSSFSDQHKLKEEKPKLSKNKPPIIKIYANENFSLNKFKSLKLERGDHKINIIVENQRLALPDLYQVSSSIIDKIRLIEGVKQVSVEK